MLFYSGPEFPKAIPDHRIPQGMGTAKAPLCDSLADSGINQLGPQPLSIRNFGALETDRFRNAGDATCIEWAMSRVARGTSLRITS